MSRFHPNPYMELGLSGGHCILISSKVVCKTQCIFYLIEKLDMNLTIGAIITLVFLKMFVRHKEMNDHSSGWVSCMLATASFSLSKNKCIIHGTWPLGWSFNTWEKENHIWNLAIRVVITSFFSRMFVRRDAFVLWWRVGPSVVNSKKEVWCNCYNRIHKEGRQSTRFLCSLI